MSNSYSLFNSGVIYEDPKHGDLILENVQMRWQHSFNNDISIAELRPPYKGDFNCRFQDFKFVNNSLIITGTHHDDPSIQYRVTLR